jgi:hypothetical protein
VFADLGGERPIGAQKGEEKIAVEVKSFIGKSDIHEMELAVGQYTYTGRFLNTPNPIVCSFGHPEFQL